ALLLLPISLPAQGRIIGRVLDPGGEALSGARVAVVGTSHQSTTNVDGRYSINGVPVGIVELRVTLVGFSPKRVTGVPVTDGEVTEQDMILVESAVQLQELTVSAAVEQRSISSA